MRISLAYSILIASSIQLLASNSNGQTIDKELVTIELQNDNLVAMVKKIEAQSTLRFIYLPEQLSKYGNVTLSKGKRTIRETLELALIGTGLAYEESGKYVVLKQGSAARVAFVRRETMTVRISGRVIDQDGQGIAGVNIIIKGTASGTTTDMNGEYALLAEENDILVFSFIGYKTLEVNIGSRTTVDTRLELDVESLKEVEVRSTGYWTESKEKSPADISKVDAKEITRQPITSPLMALQGRMPGVDISPRNGAAGGFPKIQIRGQNSLRLDGGYPLYVIDGVPVDARPLQSASTSVMDNGFDPLSFINPENIESIEVLKDAAATSIYGSRGANGVIRITTKRSMDRNRASFDLSFYSGIGQVANKTKMLNTQQYMAMRREAYKNDNSAPLSFGDWDTNGVWDSTRYTNWENKLIGGKANITDLQIGLSGGNNLTNFRFGTGYHREGVIYPGDFGFKRFTANLALNHSSFDQRFKFSVSANYGWTNNRIFDDVSMVNYALYLPPNAPRLYNDDGGINWEIASLFGGTFDYATWTNPIASLLKTHNSDIGNLVANSNIGWELLPNLLLKANIGYTELNSNEVIKTPIAASSPLFTWTAGVATFGSNHRRSWIAEPQLVYKIELGEHLLSLNGGATFQSSNSTYQSVVGTGYTSDVLLNSVMAAPMRNFNSDESIDYKYTAIFGRIGYSFRNRYIVDLTARRDGSSRFGPGRQFGNFGAIGVAWLFSEEPILKSSILSLGKLRASYGSSGNDQIGDYNFLNLYTLSGYSYNGVQGLRPQALLNPRFGWEVTKKMEAGLEVGFLRGRLSLEASWYRNRSSNQLVEYQLPATTGFPSVLSNFNATIENSGWEFICRSRNVESDKLQWTTSINLSVPSNKLVKFNDIENSPYATTYEVGTSISIQRVYKWEGVDPSTGQHKFLDKNGDGVINVDDRIFSRPLVKQYYGGMLNSFVYGSFELSFLVQLSKSTIYGYLPVNAPGSKGNQPEWILNRWKAEGDVTDVAKFSQSYENLEKYGFLTQSDENIKSIFFMRLKTASVSYRLPISLIGRMHVQAASVFVQGQNLLTIKTFDKVLDPETINGLPPLQVFTAGFQIKI